MGDQGGADGQGWAGDGVRAYPVQREAAEYLFSFFPGLEDKISVDDYLAERVEMQDAEFKRVPYMRGALELVQGLHANGIPIALATGSSTRNFEVKTVGGQHARTH